MRIAREHRFRMSEIVSVYADIAGKMRGNGRGVAILADADAMTDRAAAFEVAIALQSREIGLSVICIITRIVVHQEHVFGHVEPPHRRYVQLNPATTDAVPPADYLVKLRYG
jgi:hypothetical protein